MSTTTNPFQLSECGLCSVRVLNVRECYTCKRLFCVRCNSGQATATAERYGLIRVGGDPTCVECFRKREWIMFRGTN